MTYLLDANVVSELLRERPDRDVEQEFRTKAKRSAIAAPAFYEIAFGIAALHDGARKRALADGFAAVVGGMRVVSFDRAAARWLADENARLRRSGRPSGILDGQIAAIAATRGYVLVTRNLRHFEAYAGLRIETWSSSHVGERG